MIYPLSKKRVYDSYRLNIFTDSQHALQIVDELVHEAFANF